MRRTLPPATRMGGGDNERDWIPMRSECQDRYSSHNSADSTAITPITTTIRRADRPLGEPRHDVAAHDAVDHTIGSRSSKAPS